MLHGGAANFFGILNFSTKQGGKYANDTCMYGHITHYEGVMPYLEYIQDYFVLHFYIYTNF